MNLPYKTLNVLMVLAAAIATAVFYADLPATVPSHWNVRGEADGFSERWMVWLLGPGLMALMLALNVVLPKISPKRFEIDPFRRTFDYSFMVIIAFLGFIYGAMLAAALGYAVRTDWAIPAAISVLLILLGNPMGKVKPNFFLGVRTPWTLASPRVWHATHRLAGQLMVAAGVIGLAAMLAGAPGWLVVPLAGTGVLVAVVHSYLVYKRLSRSGQLE